MCLRMAGKGRGRSRKGLEERRNGLTGYRIQYKRMAIERVVSPIGVVGTMSKRLLYTRHVGVLPRAANPLIGVRAAALASLAFTTFGLRFRSSCDVTPETNINGARRGHAL